MKILIKITHFHETIQTIMFSSFRGVKIKYSHFDTVAIRKDLVSDTDLQLDRSQSENKGLLSHAADRPQCCPAFTSQGQTFLSPKQ